MSKFTPWPHSPNKIFSESRDFFLQTFYLIFDYEFDFCHLCKTKRFELYGTKSPDATYFPVWENEEMLARGHRGFLGNQSEYRVMTSYFEREA